MQVKEWFNQLFEVINSTKCKINSQTSSFEEACDHVCSIFNELGSGSNRLYWVGNGGSSALCTHLSQDCLNKLGIASMSLNDSSMLTCMANDYGYENVYTRPLETYFQEGDVLIAISSSGNSENILNSAELAKHKGGKVIALSAFSEENKLNKIDVDVQFYLPCSLYGHAEVGHEAVLHAIIETLFLSKQ